MARSSCGCDVCVALAGLTVSDVYDMRTESRLDDLQLSEDVKRVLVAQHRIVRGDATAEHIQLVQEAAARCTGMTFRVLRPH
tara:strand:+ start:5473 stop:5718 length:246 start_codon:yes stop_codon:yes gene_type:complete